MPKALAWKASCLAGVACLDSQPAFHLLVSRKCGHVLPGCPHLLSRILKPDHFTAQATADCRRSCGRASKEALPCRARGRPGLVRELDSLLKPGASSVRCFASMSQSCCCTVHSCSPGTYCAAISPLRGGRFCIAESHGLFLWEAL